MTLKEYLDLAENYRRAKGGAFTARQVIEWMLARGKLATPPGRRAHVGLLTRALRSDPLRWICVSTNTDDAARRLGWTP